MLAVLNETWTWKRIDLDDLYYYYPSWEDWDRVFLKVMANLPKYVPERFDCDNFASYIAVLTAMHFKINTCGVVEGFADVGTGKMGRHKWNVFFDGDTFYQLESQKYGAVMSLEGNSKYLPDEISMG